MFDKFYMIGFGSIATSLIELCNLENKYFDIPITIIEPRDIKHPELFNNRQVTWMQTELTQDNYKQLLKGLNKNTLVIDLSVNVDSLMIIKYCLEKGCAYINTSIENYATPHNMKKKNLTYDDIKDNTIYHRELLLEKLYQENKTTKRPIIVNAGQNPGCIQQYFKYALKQYAKMQGKKLIKGDYAKLAHDLGLKEILLCEYDSQKTPLKPNKTNFYNTWSCVGLQEEASDYTTLSLNNDDIEKMEKQGIQLIKPDEGEATNIRYLPEYGMNVKRSGICLDHTGKPFSYDGGMLIPHSEICSLSRFLQYQENSPSIMYVYRVCDAAIESLKHFKDNNYKILKNDYVLEQKDVNDDGFDSIGTLLIFENGDKMWCGSVVNNNDAKKLGFKISTATSIQVSGAVYAFIEYMFSHPEEGLNETETLHHDEIFKKCKKFLGNFYCKML